MMKVLILEEGPGFGGALVSLKRLLENFPNEEYSFNLITNYHQTYIEKGGKIVETQVMKRKRLFGRGSSLEKALGRVFGKYSGPLAYLIDRVTLGERYVRQVSGYIRKKKIDLVHLNNWPLLNDGGLSAAKRAGRPVIMHVRGWEYEGNLIRWLLNQADHIIAVSNYIKARVVSLGIKSENISVVPDSIDVASFSQGANYGSLRDEMGIDSRTKVLGLIGCLVNWKGHKIFLEAFSSVIRKMPAVALIVGDTPDGSQDYRRELEDYAKQLGVSNDVQFIGHRRDVASVMAACDVIIHASTSPEPFGMVVIEAMSLGKPVVATAAGGPKEIIHNGVDGLLVPPSDPRAMANAIITILESPALRYKMAKAARKKVKMNYDISAHAEKVARIYEKVRERKG